MSFDESINNYNNFNKLYNNTIKYNNLLIKSINK